MRNIGLIVNPIAGMGGRVGLKGTDGAHTLERALSLGARPESALRATAAIAQLAPVFDRVTFVTPPGKMGADIVTACGVEPEVLPMDVDDGTTADHTIDAVDQLKDRTIDILLFAGGDGTARDIVARVQDQVVSLGIPTGVKMHSAVFGVNPSRAGELAAWFLFDRSHRTRAAEVMDIDEQALREGHVTARLFGYMTIPFRRGHVQGLKAGTSESELFVQQSIAREVVDEMKDEVTYVIGPGTTTAEVMKLLGQDYSLVGVDLVRDGRLLGKDLGEQDLLSLLDDQPSGLIVTPVGGQGYLLGRGNQPISAEVLRRVEKQRIIIAATPHKLSSLRGYPLRVDSGDAETDLWLSGYYKVVSGHRNWSVYQVVPA
jgi:predicted polyphosphate/ATP-dependent NAD kinase